MRINRHVSKTSAAFLLTADRLFQEFPNSVYFWTFTWPTVMSDWRYGYSWNSFATRIRNFFGGTVVGVRVVEIHPGEFSHGLHYHALVSRRLNIHIVRRIAKACGMGLCWVVKADTATKFYLAKYLTKESELSKGCRKWGTIGGFKPCTVRNLEIDSDLTRNMRWAREECNMGKSSYSFFTYVSNNTRLYGPIQEWPVKKLRCVTKENFVRVKYVDITPDDDGKTYSDLHPLKTRFEKLSLRKFNLCGRTIEQFYRSKAEEPF